jgi:glutaredoxin
MKIRAFLKPQCGWSMGVRAIMDKYSLEYDDLDIINNPDLFHEMVELTGQTNQPCVEIDGVMLADVSGEEVEDYLKSNNLVKLNDEKPSVPIDSACSDEEHRRMAEEQTSPVRFF